MAIQSNFAFTGTLDTNCTYTSNNAQGNTSVVGVYLSIFSGDPTSGVACTDTNGNTYALETSILDSSANTWLGIFVAFNINAGANTVEFTSTIGQSSYVFIAEEPASSGLRAANSVTFSGSSSNPTMPLAGTETGDVVVALGGQAYNKPGLTSGNIGTNPATSLQTDGSLAWEDGVSTGGTINATFTGADLAWDVTGVALIPAVSPTVPNAYANAIFFDM